MSRIRDARAPRHYDLGNGIYHIRSHSERSRPTKRFVEVRLWQKLTHQNSYTKVWMRENDNAPNPLYLMRLYDPQYGESTFLLARGQKVMLDLAKKHHARLCAWAQKKGRTLDTHLHIVKPQYLNLGE